MDINSAIFKKTITEDGLKTISQYGHIVSKGYHTKSHVDEHGAWMRRKNMVKKGWKHKDPTYATSYFSDATMVYKYIRACVKAPNNLKKIQEWDAQSGTDLVLSARFSHPIGEGYLLYGDPDNSLPMSGIRIVLEFPANPEWPFSIKTAYPTFTEVERRNALMTVKAFQKELASLEVKPMYSMCMA